VHAFPPLMKHWGKKSTQLVEILGLLLLPL
jgi:hypothetical protein